LPLYIPFPIFDCFYANYFDLRVIEAMKNALQLASKQLKFAAVLQYGIMMPSQQEKNNDFQLKNEIRPRLRSASYPLNIQLTSPSVPCSTQFTKGKL
jgi:hypothetical protein